MIKQFFIGLFMGFLGVGCSTTPRFKDQPVTWKVYDNQDISEPKEFRPTAAEYFGGIFFTRRLTRLLELGDIEVAHNTNAIDELPDSTWFTNRIGIQNIAPETIAKGLNSEPPKLPLTVIQGKSGGGHPGFRVKDQEAREFLVKFDIKKNPEIKTASSVIVNRIFWGAGYHVPSDNIFQFCRGDLELSPDAKIKDKFNNMVPMTWKDVDKVLKNSPLVSNDCYRVLASEIIKGKPKGGFDPEGVRGDDPNDRIPHEHRRELRGLKVFSAWLSNTDILQGNTLDIYVNENGRGFIRHYLVDFDATLGAHKAIVGHNRFDWENDWDWTYQPGATVSFGLWKRPWESLKETPWPSVGIFSSDHFDPERWREAFPYWPFTEVDITDAYWAAKIIMKFSRDHLKAIVAEGKFSNLDAADYMVETLMKRRDIIGKTYFEAVSPIDYFKVNGNSICAEDLSIQYDLVRVGSLERILDNGKIEAFPISHTGEVCFPMQSEKGYHSDRLRIRRNHDVRPIMQLHYIYDQTPRIVGLVRVE